MSKFIKQKRMFCQKIIIEFFRQINSFCFIKLPEDEKFFIAKLKVSFYAKLMYWIY